jgi:mannose-1-phosphate guanylyltransferase
MFEPAPLACHHLRGLTLAAGDCRCLQPFVKELRGFVYRRCPEAMGAFFPSDHFILEEDRFMKHLQLAFRAVMDDSTRLILLAVAPRHAETEYGCMIPIRGAAVGSLARFGVKSVSAFVEKPRPELAR